MFTPATRRRVGPFLFLLSMTVLLTWPTAATLTTHAVDRQDPLLNAWIMAWEARQLLIDPLALFDANIFFPLRHTLAFSEILLSTSALVMPLQWAFDHALLSYNVAFLLVFLSSALGAYLLALYHTGQRGAALVAAIAFAWSPYRLGQISQIQLLAYGWLPLALLYLDRLLRGSGRGERRWLRDALLFALFFFLQALASFYAALFSGVACALYTGGWLLWKRGLPRTAVAGGALAAGIVVLAMLPFALPYYRVQQTLGAGWTLAQNEQFSASLQSYLLAPEGTRVWGPLTRPFAYLHGPCCPPSTLFPGVTLLLLGGVALWRGRGGRRWIWLLIGGVAFLLSLGPTLTVWANAPTSVPLPYRWLWEWVPGFNGVRAPVRWASLLTLALAMGGALGVARLGGRWVAPLALLLVTLEFAALPLRVVPVPASPDSLSWLDAQPPTRIVELPLVAERPRPAVPAAAPRRAWESSRLLEAQYFSTFHWHSTPDGYSGYVPVRHGDFAREMAAFPSPRAAAMLEGLGVRYVVVHLDDMAPPRDVPAFWQGQAGTRVVRQEGRDLILAPDAALAPDLPTERLPLRQLPAAQPILLPLLLEVGSAPYVPVAGEPLEITVRWTGAARAQHEQRVFVRWPMIVEEVAVLRLPVEAPPAGTWRLALSGSYPEGRGFIVEETVEVVEGALLPLPLAVRLEGAQRAGDDGLLLRWRALELLERHYSLSVRLLDSEGSVVAQKDGAPAALPTIAWLPGIPYEATWRFDALPAGHTLDDLTVQLLWYDPERDAPLLLWDGADFVPELQIPPGPPRE